MVLLVVLAALARWKSRAEVMAGVRRMTWTDAGRAALLDQHRDGAFNDMMLTSLEQEMDLEELRILRLLGATPAA